MDSGNLVLYTIYRGDKRIGMGLRNDPEDAAAVAERQAKQFGEDTSWKTWSCTELKDKL